MKKYLLFIATTLIMGFVTVSAQEQRPQRMNMSQRTEQIIKELGLDDNQAKDFKKIMEDMRPGNISENERPSREEMKKRRDEMNEKIKKILTEEQYKKYQEMFQRHNNRPDGNSQNQ